MPARRDLLGLAVPVLQLVGDLQRSQRQRHQGRDTVALPNAERRLRAGLVDNTDEHAAGAGDRVLHLAAGPDDVQDRAADRRTVTAVRLGQLAVRRGVQVQALDRDADLVGPDLGTRVEFLRRLRQHAGRREYTVQSYRARRHRASS